jgi:hypothetical protein
MIEEAKTSYVLDLTAIVGNIYIMLIVSSYLIYVSNYWCILSKYKVWLCERGSTNWPVHDQQRQGNFLWLFSTSVYLTRGFDYLATNLW